MVAPIGPAGAVLTVPLRQPVLTGAAAATGPAAPTTALTTIFPVAPTRIPLGPRQPAEDGAAGTGQQARQAAPGAAGNGNGAGSGGGQAFSLPNGGRPRVAQAFLVQLFDQQGGASQAQAAANDDHPAPTPAQVANGARAYGQAQQAGTVAASRAAPVEIIGLPRLQSGHALDLVV